MDSFDDMLVGLLISREGSFEFSSVADQELAQRWAGYSFEAGRASVRKRKRLGLSQEMPEFVPPVDVMSPEHPHFGTNAVPQEELETNG